MLDSTIGATTYLGRVMGETAVHLLESTRDLVANAGLATGSRGGDCAARAPARSLVGPSGSGSGSGVSLASAAAASETAHDARLGSGGGVSGGTGSTGGARRASCAEHCG